MAYWPSLFLVSFKNIEENWSEISQSVIRAIGHELLRFSSRAGISPFASASTRAMKPNRPLMQWPLDVLPLEVQRPNGISIARLQVSS
jgi:hypothetical protein